LKIANFSTPVYFAAFAIWYRRNGSKN